MDAYFRIQGFGKMNAEQRDAMKFNLTIMHLDERLYEQAYEVIQNPPESEKYATLRKTVLAKFSSSSMARLEQLIAGIQLGDGKPSHMLSQLQRTGVTSDQKLIKGFWLQRLPVDTRGILAVFAKSNPDTTVESLAAIADEVMDVTHVNAAVSNS